MKEYQPTGLLNQHQLCILGVHEKHSLLPNNLDKNNFLHFVLAVYHLDMDICEAALLDLTDFLPLFDIEHIGEYTKLI